MNGRKSYVKTMAMFTSEGLRQESLTKDLILGNYAWFPVKGQSEGEGTSCIVCNISLGSALYLARKFGQETIIFIDGAKCEYWEHQGRGKYQKTDERLIKERLDMTDAADYFMQVSSAFKSQIPFFDGSDEYRTMMQESIDYVNQSIRKNVKDQDEAERRIESSLHAPSGYNRFCNRAALYSNDFKMRDSRKHSINYR